MAELNFQITGVEPAARALTPLLQFNLEITTAQANQPVQGALLNVQIQFQPAHRTYSPSEKARLVELFGPPERWGQTLRNRLLAHAQATVGAFEGRTKTVLQVPCSYDLNLASAKYFYALESGDVSLLFLFSGSVFCVAESARLQMEPISWNKECQYRMPLQVWRELMEAHFPNSAWLTLPRDVFDRLCDYKRGHSLATWEQTVAHLLDAAQRASSDSQSRSAGQEQPAAAHASIPEEITT